VSALVLQLEWQLAIATKRDFAMRVLAPLSVVLVLATGAVPPAVAAASYAALLTGMGLLATALPLMRDGDEGMVQRVLRGGVPPASYLLQRAAAAAGLTLLQLSPAVLLGAVWLGASTAEVVVAFGALVLALWISCLLGVVIGAVGRSAAEATLICVLTAGLLLHVSGVFHSPAIGGLGAALEGGSPFRMLHESLAVMVSGGRVHGGVSALLWSIVLPALVAGAAPRLRALLEREPRPARAV